MRSCFAAAPAVLLATFALTQSARAHGAIYNPTPEKPKPQDPTKPPTPAGPSAPSDPGPTSKPTSGPATGAPSTTGPATRPPERGPSTGGPQGPRGVATGGGPTSSPEGPHSPSSGGPSAPSGIPTDVQGAIELASWEDWWHFNKDPYLDVRRAVLSSVPATGVDELALGNALPGRPTREMLEGHVAPGLRKLLQEERANDIVTGALVALARIGEPGTAAVAAAASTTQLSNGSSGVAELLSRSLADANQEVSETAALALGILRAESAIPDLESLVRDDSRGRALLGGGAVPTRTRAFAAIGLGLTAERASTNRARQLVARALTAVLDEEHPASPDVQVAAVLGLALDPIDIEAVESASVPWVSRQTVVRRLIQVFSDTRRHRMLRAHAAVALARLAQDAPEPLRTEVAELLLDALRGGTRLENEVVQSCVQALGVLAGASGSEAALLRETRSALVRQLDRPDHATRCFALVALAEAGARSASAPDAGSSEHVDACRAAIVNEIVRGKRSMRPWAVLALGVLERRLADRGVVPSASARELLRSALASARQRDEIGSAAIALGLARDPQAEPLLRAKLADTNEDSGQGYVALALGMVGAGDTIPALRALARASKYRPDVLEQSACALALLGDSGIGPDLAAAFAQAPGQAAQAALARAIGAIGDRRCVDPLLRLAVGRDGTAAARGFAAAALGKVADGDLLPWYSKIACDLDYRACPAFLLSGDGTGLLEIL